MSGYFFDTSALVKHYHPEVGSDKVWKILFDANHRCFVSRLGMLETQIVFAAKVRGGFISDAEFLKYRHYLFTDASRRLFRIIRVMGRHYDEAERLVGRVGTIGGLRTLDAIQLSVAALLKARGAIDYFVCADKKLAHLASIEQFAVIDPEQP